MGDNKQSAPATTSEPLQLTPEQRALMQLQAQMQQLQAQVAMRQSSAASAASSRSGTEPIDPVYARPGLRPKIKEPSLYAGDPLKLDGWFQELSQQFRWYQLSADGDRISLATAHLRGPALDWWCSVETQPALSWEVFVSALRSRFQPISTATVARRQLDQ